MDPMTALGVAGSTVGVAGFGLQIATTLQTYVEATLEADDRIRDIATDISATASALERLQVVIAEDATMAKCRVLSNEGLKAVDKLASQCDLVFRRIVDLLNKAGRPGDQLSKSDRPRELKISTFDQLKWPWLEPKILRCRKELERLLLKLLLMLQIAHLANYQRAHTRQHSTYRERELWKEITKLTIREHDLNRELKQAHAVNSFPAESGGNPPQKPVLAGEAFADTTRKTEQGTHSVAFVGSAASSQSMQSSTRRDITTAESTDPVVLGESVSKLRTNSSGSLSPQTHGQESYQQGTFPRIEVYLNTDANRQAVRIPVAESEIHQRLGNFGPLSSVWQDFISLPSEDQAEAARIVETAVQRDSLHLILAAIITSKWSESVGRFRPKIVWHRETLLFFQVNDQLPVSSTRLPRRVVSAETLTLLGMPFKVLDNDYLLVKRWVPECEQEWLYNHTKMLRDQQRSSASSSFRLESSGYRGSDVIVPRWRRNQSPIVKYARGSTGRQRRPLLVFKALSRRFGRGPPSTRGAEDMPPLSEVGLAPGRRFGRGPPSARGAGDMPPLSEAGSSVERPEWDYVPPGVVDDLLAKWTTVFEEAYSSKEKQMDGFEDMLEGDFLESTKLDDYPAGDGALFGRELQLADG